MKSLIPEALRKRYRALTSVGASLYYGSPSRRLKLIGVTGTSGKSTTSTMLYHVLNSCGVKTGIISTVGAKAGDMNLDTGFHTTTPNPIDLQRILKIMVKKKMEYVIIEASSHAIAQGRLGNLQFEHCIFTNIKRDHLDWHGSWEHYATSKAKLIDYTKNGGGVIINRDDKEAYSFLSQYIKRRQLPRLITTYSLNEATSVEETAIGTRFVYGGVSYRLAILGSYNIENGLAVINTCKIMGLDDELVSKALESFIGLEGRMQVMQPMPFIVIVDFAHNADSLEKSLKSARKLIEARNKIICVFGSAGLRDVEKRYTMGHISAEYADVTVVTAEDPRIESLYDINSQIIEGATKSGGKLIKRFANTKEYTEFEINPVLVNKGEVYAFDEESVASRYDAIAFACKIARPGDLVITEGKGHEQSLCFGTVEYPFTDQDAVEKALKNL